MIDKWIIEPFNEKAVRELAAKGNISMMAAAALVSMGHDTPEKAAAFLDTGIDGQRLSAGLSDPMTFRDMDKAVRTIREAAEKGEYICVYGDYDCDGITATSLLVNYLGDMGAQVTSYINERSEGYGMNCDAIRKLHVQGIQLIITVDNGISCHDEAKLCRELGIKLVITDHHMPGERLPDALAVVDPHRADCPSIYKDYCGCGIALMLVGAMEGDLDMAVEQYSDLAAVATVADVVPLDGENRIIVRHGLHFLENTERPGLAALMEKAGLKKPYNSRQLAFGAAPRINAAGRIGSPKTALAMLEADVPEDAEKLSEKVCVLNGRRKEIEDGIMEDITGILAKSPEIMHKRVLAIRGKEWDHGVIGIAASRVAEKFGKPVFLMSEEEGGGMLRGSARWVEGFDVFGGLTYCGELLDKYGGHKGAGGFSLKEENFDEFDRRLQEYAAGIVQKGGCIRNTVRIVCGVTPADLTTENVEGLDVLEPFGEGNPRPLFLLTDCAVSGIVPLSNGVHSKLILTGTKSQGSVTGLMFRTSPNELPCKEGDVINALISPEINEYNGRRSVSVQIRSIRRQGMNQAKLMGAEEAYGSFKRGERLSPEIIGGMTPSRDELVAVYKSFGKDKEPVMRLYDDAFGKGINYCKFLLCLDIFSEAGLIEYDSIAGRAGVIPGAPKADLDKTETMKRLRQLIVSPK
ncbi:MAG: single-stranded-DNA-specific exonuclease RecJ [Ruminococcus sp.]|nr:single-stranded-DNA-specific exonuclease RecJ [Ruminococcus sp.]